jgi:UDP-N-acetylmuramyl tripeptide synthase
MDIRLSIAIAAGKMTRFAIRAIGRNASSFPGGVALKLCPDLLRRMQMPKKIVAVTGSNGKTTTTQMIHAALQRAGMNVICNTEGSNQIQGVTAMFLKHCTLGGVVKADAALIESDERFCQYTFKQITPDYMVITNLYRDQMTRNGHSEFVRKELAKGLPEKTVLIVNADEPVSAALAVGRKAIRYGLAADLFPEKEGTPHAYHDGAYCPVCYAPMSYESRVFSHVGNYKCPSCGFARGTVDHEVSAGADGAFLLDGQYTITPQMYNTNFAYNIAAAYAALVDAFDFQAEQAAASLDRFVIRGDRLHEFELNGHRGLFTLTKHENSMAYNAALAELNTVKEATLVLIVDQLSRKYIANDMSWLWDIDFEPAGADGVKRVLVSGQFAYDVAVRLQFAGVDPERLTVEPDMDKMMMDLKENAVGDIYVMTCFTDVGKFTSRLKEVQA